MIEKLLLRIARRGPGLSQFEPGDASIAPSSSPSPSPSQSQSSSPSAPQATGVTQVSQADAPGFPCRRQPLDTSDSVPCAVEAPSVWDKAKKSHYSGGTPEQRALALPSAYANYGAVHAKVGAVIWSERMYINENIVHIVSRVGQVVAAIYPDTHTVAVRKTSIESPPDSLSMKELPSSAQPFEGDAASKFDTSSMHMLLWYYGQVDPQALENIPQPLLRSKMLLRRLPFLMPNALSPRHLHLIHLFSAGPLLLRDLFKLLKPEFTPLICADLTSLYLTGCLVAAEREAQPA